MVKNGQKRPTKTDKIKIIKCRKLLGHTNENRSSSIVVPFVLQMRVIRLIECNTFKSHWVVVMQQIQNHISGVQGRRAG